MHSNFTLKRLSLLLPLLLILTSSIGQDGTLDTQFGTGGRTWEQSVSYPISTSNPGVAARVLVQPDNKIIHISPTGSVGMILTRYLPDGVVDPSFGNNGRIEYTDVQTFYQPRDAVMLADGKFLVAGEYRVQPFGAEHGFAVVRFNADGTIDNSFSGDGRSVIALASSNPVARGLLVQPDGKIVIVGSSPGLYTIVRMNSDGTADTGFDSDGIVKTSVGSGSESAYAAALAPDGRLVVAGDALNPVVINGATQYRLDLGIIRLLPDGSLDAAFGSGGKTSYITPEAKDLAKNVAVDAMGRITVSGEWSSYSAADNSGYFAARFLSSGAADPSFGSNGLSSITTPGIAVSSDLLVQQDGKLILGGYTLCTFLCPTDGYVNIVLARLTANGALDQSFNGGKVTVEYLFHTPASPSFGWVDVGGTLAMQGTKIIVGGLARYQGSTKALLVRLNNSVGEAGGIQYVTIPALIQAETYSNQSGTQLEGTSDSGGGQNVGYIDNGDWLDYAIAVPQSGSYQLSLRVASQMSGAQFGVYSNSGQLLATIDVPNTGGWQNWITLSATVQLTGGNQVLRLQSHNASNWNINWLQFATGTTPPPSSYVQIPAKLEAEAYTAQSGTQLEYTADAGGGQNAGYIDAGDWLEYKIHVPVSGTYNMLVRTASAVDGGFFEVRTGNGVLITTFSVPNTGGWQNWLTLNKPVSLTAGDQVIRILSTGSNWNLNWLEFTQSSNPPPPTYVTLPARIEAENYLAQNGTQLEGTTDAGGGQNVGYIDAGDWLEYGVSSVQAGSYQVTARVASQMSGGSFELRDHLGNVLATYLVPNTGGWQNWVSLNATVSLPAGSQKLRIVSTGGANWNINWIEFSTIQNPGPGYVTVPATIQAESYTAMSGVQTETTADNGGGQNVGYIDYGDFIEYKISVAQGGSYILSMRTATPNGGAQVQLSITNDANGQQNTQNVSLPNSGGYQVWTTHSLALPLAAGNYTVRITSLGDPWNFNWWRVAEAVSPSMTKTEAEGIQLRSVPSLQVYPNPAGSETLLSWEDGYRGTVRISLVNQNGSIVRTLQVQKGAERLQQRLLLEGLAPGIYYVQVSSGRNFSILKILKQ